MLTHHIGPRHRESIIDRGAFSLIGTTVDNRGGYGRRTESARRAAEVRDRSGR